MDRYGRYLRLGVVASDALAVVLACTVAAGMRFGFAELRPDGGLWPAYPAVSLGIALVAIGLNWGLGTYRLWALTGGYRVYPRVMTVAASGVIAIAILGYLVDEPPLLDQRWLLEAWAGSVVCLFISRFAWQKVAFRWRRAGVLIKNVLIAGANQQGIAVARQLNDPAQQGTRVLGFLDDYHRPGTEVSPGLKVVGHPDSLLEHAAALGADEVVIIAGALAWESQRMLAEMVTRPDSPIEARISPTYYDLLTTSAELSHVASVPMLTLHSRRISGIKAFIKEFVDRSLASVVLLLIAPTWIYWRLKAWALRVPMLASERVLGLEGRPFDLIALNKRLTGSDLLVRLPALWNVIRQDLSLVGPRPLRVAEVQSHERWLANLFAMRPGLTGFWRLRSGEPALEDRVALDLYYIRNYTLALDIQILWSTAKGLLLQAFGRAGRSAGWTIAAGEETTAPPRGNKGVAAANRPARRGSAPVDSGESQGSMNMELEEVTRWLSDAAKVLETVDATAVVEAAEALAKVLDHRGTIFIAGNGGSATTATHFACDLQKAGGRANRRTRAIALSDNAALVTAWGNDLSFDRIFAEQLKVFGSEGDALVVISVSGSSPNLLAALEVAKDIGLATVGLLGVDGGEARSLVDHAVVVASDDYGWVESAHVVIEHAMTYYLQAAAARARVASASSPEIVL